MFGDEKTTVKVLDDMILQKQSQPVVDAEKFMSKLHESWRNKWISLVEDFSVSCVHSIAGWVLTLESAGPIRGHNSQRLFRIDRLSSSDGQALRAVHINIYLWRSRSDVLYMTRLLRSRLGSYSPRYAQWVDSDYSACSFIHAGDTHDEATRQCRSRYLTYLVRWVINSDNPITAPNAYNRTRKEIAKRPDVFTLIARRRQSTIIGQAGGWSRRILLQSFMAPICYRVGLD